MKHSRRDYQDRIIDLAGIIGEEEPVFLLRSQDRCSNAALHSYLTELVAHGAGYDIIANVRAALLSFVKWQKEHETKVPDVGEPVEYPVSDHPQLTKALAEKKALQDKNEMFATKLNRVAQQLNEYAERYSDLKILYENNCSTILKLEQELTKEKSRSEVRGGELTQLRYDYKVLLSAKETAEKMANDLQNNLVVAQTNFQELENELQNTKNALQKEIESNSI